MNETELRDLSQAVEALENYRKQEREDIKKNTFQGPRFVDNLIKRCRKRYILLDDPWKKAA